MKPYLLIALICFVAGAVLVYSCENKVKEDLRIAKLQADTARQVKIIRSLQFKADSTYSQAIKAEEANIKPKEERKELKKELPKSKTLKDSANILLKLEKNAYEIIERQDTVIDDLKKVKLFQDSTINHLETKVKDVGEMNAIHLKEYIKEKRKNFWNKVLMIALPVVAFILGLMAAK